MQETLKISIKKTVLKRNNFKEDLNKKKTVLKLNKAVNFKEDLNKKRTQY